MKYLVVECIGVDKILVMEADMHRTSEELVAMISDLDDTEDVSTIMTSWLTDNERKNMFIKVVSSIDEANRVCKEELGVTLGDALIKELKILAEKYKKDKET